MSAPGRRRAASYGAPRPRPQAWAELAAGNTRFVEGEALHPNQDAARRHSLAPGQRPFAALFGCADSRVAAEIIFDLGLGDLFVVRTAGHVVDTGVLGSLEFGVGVLGHPAHRHPRARLVRRRGRHDGGGRHRRAARWLHPRHRRAGDPERADRPPGRPHVRTDEIETEHVRHTIRLLVERSSLIADRIASGRLAVVGAAYNLDEGRARMVDAVGDLGDLGEGYPGAPDEGGTPRS